jgi:hypothetical protein
MGNTTMMIAIWALGLLSIALWSVSMWAVHLAWDALAGVSWAEAGARLQSLQVPAALEPWFGAAWKEWLDAMQPVLEWGLPALQTASGWLGGAMPLLIWAAWGLGTAFLLALTGATAGGVWWWRRRHAIAAAA